MNTEQHFKARIIMFICGIAAMTFGIALSCKESSILKRGLLCLSAALLQ